MSDQSNSPSVRLYSNDLELERAKQNAAASSEHRLAVLRNRIARSQAGNLTAIAMVAAERNDRTIAKEARARLQELDVIQPGAKLADHVVIVQSRRPSRSKEMQAVAGESQAS